MVGGVMTEEWEEDLLLIRIRCLPGKPVALSLGPGWARPAPVPGIPSPTPTHTRGPSLLYPAWPRPHIHTHALLSHLPPCDIYKSIWPSSSELVVRARNHRLLSRDGSTGVLRVNVRKASKRVSAPSRLARPSPRGRITGNNKTHCGRRILIASGWSSGQCSVTMLVSSSVSTL